MQPKAATPAQIATLKLMVPNIDQLLNEFQMETLATNLDTNLLPDEREPVLLKEVLPGMYRQGDATTEKLTELVVMINIPKVHNRFDEMIAKHGWAFMGVGGDRDWSPSIYTIGLCKEYGLELLFIAPLNMTILQQVTTSYVNLIRDQKVPVEELLKPRSDILNGAGGRTFLAKLVKVNREKATENYVRVTRGEGFDVYQIVIQDANNKFPGEEGYNEDFRQETEELE
jgi:hypothetical protein